MKASTIIIILVLLAIAAGVAWLLYLFVMPDLRSSEAGSEVRKTVTASPEEVPQDWAVTR